MKRIGSGAVSQRIAAHRAAARQVVTEHHDPSRIRIHTDDTQTGTRKPPRIRPDPAAEISDQRPPAKHRRKPARLVLA